MNLVTRIRRTEEITVPHPPGEVWRVLADVATYKEWWPSTLGFRFLSQTEEAVGSEWEVLTLLGPTVRLRLEELEPPSNIRLRFFGGGLEGPGGFHLTRLDDATRVAYAVDVFARGLDVAALSHVLPLDLLYGMRMKRVLRGLRRRLGNKRKEGERLAAQTAPMDAARAAEEEAARGTATRAAEEEASHLAAARTAAEAAARIPEEAEGDGRRDLQEPRARSAPDFLSKIRAASAKVAFWLRASPRAASQLKSTNPRSAEPLSNFEIARGYLRALSSDAEAADITRFFEPNATGEELPNLILPEGATRDLEAILGHWTNSRESWSGQTFDLAGATVGGSQVAMEIRWSALAARPVGPFLAGQAVRARLALFLKFQDRRIVRHRAYVCFDPPAGAGLAAEAADEPGFAHRAHPLLAPLVSNPHPNFDIARSYLASLSAGQSGDSIATFFATDAIQEELPSRLRPAAVRRNLDAIKRSRDESLTRLSSASYELLGACGGGSKVAMEILCTTVAGAGREPGLQGTKVEARQAVFLKFRDGLMVRQRTYECV